MSAVPQKLDFLADIERGKVGEDIFKKKFLDFLSIEYEDVTERQAFQKIDTDYLSGIGSIEVKSNYRDDKVLFFEEWSNKDPGLGRKTLGWLYTTKADLIVFISKNTGTMIFLPMSEGFKDQWSKLRRCGILDEKAPVRDNKPSFRGDRMWQSAYRIVPFYLLDGFIAVYKAL